MNKTVTLLNLIGTLLRSKLTINEMAGICAVDVRTIKRYLADIRASDALLLFVDQDGANKRALYNVKFKSK